MRAFRRARTRDSSLPSGEETGKENAPEPTLSESRQPSSPHLPAPCPTGNGKLSVCAGLPAAFSTVVFQQVTLQQPRHGIIAHRGGIDRQRSGRRRQRGGFDAIDRRMNGLMGELMAGHDHRSDESPLRISQQFAEVGPCGQCGEIRRTRRFEQRKFIKPLPNIAPRPATQQCPPFTANVQIMEPPFTHLRPSLLHGTQGDRPGREGETASGQRALPAAGLRRSTQQRPEIHQSLIIGSRPLRIQQRLRQLHKNPTSRPGIDGHLYVEKPGQHPNAIEATAAAV